ncbi:RdRP-domain-containing protein [Pilatotrama ljubarskyi]|nr:RdRP-domain-containing protein [Pilatotrama ljubarskyi]
MLNKTTTRIYTARCTDGIHLSDVAIQEHPSSRATRLVDDATRFLLVSVAKKAEDRVLRGTLSRWTREGVQINGLRYRFLGFTEAQVKAGKLMFFREDHEWTVERLLSDFGDLTAVYLNSGYGKYCARLGLSFSATVGSLDIPAEAALRIPDLKAHDGSLHTDGCGMIRDTFAAQVCRKYGLPSDTTGLCSHFSIRRGGVKGLLVRYPDNKFERLCGTQSPSHLIAYRPSMHKYEGGPTVLEINNHNASPVPARLNIHFTVLLLSLGVPPQAFQRLLQDTLDVIGCIDTDREKALQYIKGELDAGLEDDYNQSLYAMLLAQQDLLEPYVKFRLRQFQKTQYEGLRKKMNLRVMDSCYLFGVVDEDGVLGPDEVYIKLPNRNGVLVRDVIVARNPAYYPGDIRKLRAVDHPVLRHHRDCIVFSRSAAHSVPDTIASGDLDGDTYFVAWEPTLIPPGEIQPLNRAPALSAASHGVTAQQAGLRRPSDMPSAAVNTFVNMKFNRLLGRMVNEWKRQVETTPLLANAEFPRQLVPLIESALDIMKTGEDFAKLEADFRALCASYSVVHLDRFVSPLEVLRRMIPEVEASSPRALECDSALVLRDEDPRLWQEYIAEAKRVMPRYNQELSGAIELDRESSSSDFSSHSRPDPYDRETKHADRLKREYQSRYFGGGTRQEYERQRLRASAWYYFGYSRNKPSFAWLGERYLNEMKACESCACGLSSLYAGVAQTDDSVVKRRPTRGIRGRAQGPTFLACPSWS